MSATANVHEENQTTVVMVHDGFTDTLHSDLRGRDLKLSENGMFTTRDKELAAEMAEKYVGHVDTALLNTDAKPQGRVLFTMPRVPYETSWDRKQREKQQHGQSRENLPQS